MFYITIIEVTGQKALKYATRRSRKQHAAVTYYTGFEFV